MKIICIGRNYADHIRELQSAVPTEPVFFLKPDSALVIRNRPFYYPGFSSNIHHEIELVLRIGRVGKAIQPRFALQYIDGIGLGIDFTARDLQDTAKQKGLPWTPSKGFDGSAPVSKFLPVSSFRDLKNISFRLDINGKTVQEGNSSMMLHSFKTLISFVSGFMTLRTGDYIFTGTPAGVGPVQIGDLLEGYLEGEKLLSCLIK